MVYLVLILYLVGVLGISGYAHWKQRKKSLEEYTIADRRLSWISASLSAFAAAASGLIFIGITGMAYAFGLPMLWYATAGVIWAYIIFFFLGPRLRVWSEALGAQTVTEFLGRRFQDNAVRVVASIVTIIFFTAYVSAQFVASGKTLLGFVGVDYVTGVWVSALIMIFYTVISGFWGVCLNDVYQGVLMILGAVVMPILAIIDFGGLEPMFRAIAAQKADLITVTGGRTLGGFLVFLFSWIGSGLMGVGNPHITVRTMAIRDPRRLVQSGILAVAVSVTLIYGVVFIGLIGRAMYPVLPDQELVYPQLAKAFHPLLTGLFLTAVIAAIMSTAAAQLILAASEFVCSLYAPFVAPKANDAHLVVLSKVCVVVIGGIALFLAFGAGKLVFWLVLFAWGGLGCAFGPVLLLSLFWRRMTKWGALAGMIAGSLTVLIWGNVPVLKKMIYEGVPGLIIATLAAVTASLLTRAVAEDPFSRLFDSPRRGVDFTDPEGASAGATRALPE